MKKTKGILPYLLILPTFLFVGLFTIFPTLSSLKNSFYTQRLNIPKYRDPVFSGLDNYKDLFTSRDFWEIMGHTVQYVVISVILTLLLSFMLALWLKNKEFSGFRVAIFHPTVLPMVSAATIWMFFFTPDYGLFNEFLGFFGYKGAENWTANPDMALWSLIIVAVWKDAGYYMIFFLSGLLNLPEDVFEALKLEGAKSWTVLFRFILPLLKRTTLFVTTVAFIGAFRIVDHVFVMTQGGPSDKTELLLYHLWQVRFDELNVGQSSAITIILIILLLIFTLSNFYFSERKD